MIDSFFKIVALAFVAIVAYNVVKNVKQEYALFIALAAGIIIIIMLSDNIVKSIGMFTSLTEKSGLDSTIFSPIFKIIGIGYITEFSSSLCEDNNCSSLSKKIQFAGKITILIMALPIINAVIEVIGGLL